MHEKRRFSQIDCKNSIFFRNLEVSARCDELKLEVEVELGYLDEFS
jgi:hypothetical protein